MGVCVYVRIPFLTSERACRLGSTNNTMPHKRSLYNEMAVWKRCPGLVLCEGALE